MPRSKYPSISKKPNQRMAVVTGKGEPGSVFTKAMPALYGSVYTLKFDLKKKTGETFKVGCPIARFPDAHTKPMDEWTITIGVPIPPGTRTLPQKVPGVPVKIETWKYGTVAESLHKGPYSKVASTVERLSAFIEESGYEIAGVHEEEYQSRPDAKVPKTLIRCPVRKKSRRK